MRILVLQHLAVEHAGIFRSFWQEAGHSLEVVELDEGEAIPSLEDFDLMAVMGGPMDVWQEDLHPWLVAEKAAIRRWVLEMGRPYFGICLGHQLLAASLGGEVSLMTSPEVGITSVALTDDGQADPLFRGFSGELETFQWHGAHVSQLPVGAVILARNDACATQAIRWGRHAYGLQYHVEITGSTVADWEAIPAYRESLQTALGREQAASLGAAVAARLPAFNLEARRLNDNLFDIVAGAATTIA